MGTETGRIAESLVAKILRDQGHKVIDQNWRTRWCEIDIVSTNKKVAYFTEVKFRSSSSFGAGYDYILDKKLKQLQFAAQFWLAKKKWSGDAILQIASVDSDNDIVFIVLDGSETR